MSVLKNESKATSLQMVEIDQNKFAVELTDGNLSVNLTKMAKPFGKHKQPINWLRTEESKEYVDALSVLQKCGSADLVQVKKGGTPDTQGTWVTDYRLAVRFAQWLNPMFALRVDQLLVDLMLGGRSGGTKLIAPNATVVENTIFPKKMGDGMVQCYYTNGVLYGRFGQIMKYLTNKQWGNHLINKIGHENIVYVAVGKTEVPFGNFKAFRNYLSYAPNQEFKKVNAVSRDVWGIDLASDSDDPYLYHYTGLQMLEIYELINMRGIKKDLVLEKLRNGRMEGGPK